jgi:hypothetical protein
VASVDAQLERRGWLARSVLPPGQYLLPTIDTLRVSIDSIPSGV